MSPSVAGRTRLAVVKASAIAPLPCPQKLPHHASPTPARFATRASCRCSSGISVPITMMHDPASGTCAASGSIRRPSGRCRSPARPKFASTSTPKCQFSPSSRSRRDALPTPPFSPKQLIPVPAPTAPLAKSSDAASIAASACASVTAIAWMSLRYPSLHSSTTGLTVEVCRPISGSARSARRISAFAQVPTPNVLVSRIGVSSQPSSFTCISPTLLPNPFSTCAAANGRSWNRSSSCGSTAVTPVSTSPSAIVACPTVTPGTSAMLLRLPGGNAPQASPRSRARIRTPIPTHSFAPVRV